MTVAEWQKRLQDTFTSEGVVGGHLLTVFDRERTCERHFTETFQGQCVAIDSFQSFFVETLEVVLHWVSQHGWPKQAGNYSLVFVYYMMMFRRYRACESLVLKGYPLDGYALIRDLKDRVIFLAGVVHNITTLPKIFGVIDGSSVSSEVWRKKVKENRRKEEVLIRRRMLGDASGLKEDTIRELKKWDDLFHEEVHGGKLTFWREVNNLHKGISPSIGPTSDEGALAMYMNRAAEVASKRNSVRRPAATAT